MTPETQSSADGLASVRVGPFAVVDATSAEVVRAAADRADQQPARAHLVFALHVGGLNSRRDVAFVEAMTAADLVYADGGSVVALAKVAGATRIERAPTTDMGWDLLREISARRGRPVRVALVGGTPGLATQAAAEFVASGLADVVGCEHGYHDDWDGPIRRVRNGAPEVTIVGLGAPREMIWSHLRRDELPPGLILTCGGWFGHITGAERRAPRLIRRSGLEWLARVAQQPRRLGPRYARGVLAVAAMVLPALRSRLRRGTG